jgi:cyanophycin synthetase
MKILDTRILNGPNYWSVNHKVIIATLDIEKYEELPTNKIRGFTTRLVRILPGLKEHHCSLSQAGGFITRMKSGTWMGHVAEHIAIELQTMSGMQSNYGKTVSAGKKGIYEVIISFKEENACIYALNAALTIIEAAVKGTSYDPAGDVKNIKKIARTYGLGPSTSEIVRAAIARNIPFIRLDQGSLVQLGYGSALKRIEATITDNTSSIAVDLASDKHRTKILLDNESIPVAYGLLINEKSELAEAVEKIGFPIVIKPNDSNQGKGVSLNITNYSDALEAFEKAKCFSKNIIVESYFNGDDYRLLVINYKLVAASRRTPAMVTGDGFSEIGDLIKEINSSPDRGEDHETILTRIPVDNNTVEYLKSQNLSLKSIPAAGNKVYLKRTANLSTGGTAEDITNLVHPNIASMAERAARVVGLDICGIDYISEDISSQSARGAVLEVNAAPGFRMHTHPSKGKSQPVGDAVVEMLFPGKNEGRIPVIAITGTNGKTTTTRLIAHIAASAGYKVGFTTTEGIYINGFLIEEGDCTGPVSARKVLSDRSVNFAVLECARGGILRSGLAFDKCSTGIVTNVAEDHIGLRGINSLEDMAHVKSLIPESVNKNGLAILNEGNDLTYSMLDRVKCRVAFFSLNHKSPRIIEHCSKGGIAAVCRNKMVVLLKGNRELLSDDVENIPCSFGGKAPFMIENLLAAILGAYSEGINPETIKMALRTFIPSFENNPGRMNLITFKNFSFLLDYAHNFHGISALGSYIRNYEATEKIGIISAAGDRRDIDIFNVGKASSELFDRIIIRVDSDTRGRPEKELIDLLYAGVTHQKHNFPVTVIRKEEEAVRYSLDNAVAGSIIVLFSEHIKIIFEMLNKYRREEMKVRELINISK